MNDDDDADDLLFSNEDIDRWKRRELPPEWLTQRKNILLARCQTQATMLKKLLASADRSMAECFHKPL